MDDIELKVGSQLEAPNDLDHEIDGPGPEPTDPAEAVGMIVTDEIARKLLQLPFNVMATKRGNHWLLTEPETDLMCQPFARLMKRYSLQLSEKYPDGFLVMIGLTAAVTARAAIDVSHRKQQEKEALQAAEKQREEERNGAY